MTAERWDFTILIKFSTIHGFVVQAFGFRETRGELSGDSLIYMDKNGQLCKEKIIWENPYKDLGFSEDETAVTKVLEGMKQYTETGIEFYPLAEALQDAYFSLCMEKALLHPYETIQSQTQMWGY